MNIRSIGFLLTVEEFVSDKRFMLIFLGKIKEFQLDILREIFLNHNQAGFKKKEQKSVSILLKPESSRARKIRQLRELSTSGVLARVVRQTVQLLDLHGDRSTSE